MTIDDLIAKLEDLKDMAPRGGETEIRVAYQPTYPIAGTIQALSLAEPFDEDDDGNMVDADLDMAPTSHDTKLWIGVGSMPYDENPYAPRWAWNDNAS